MPEYIEREALIAEYDRVHEGPAGGARKLMVDAPAADVVEIPCRCKDCKHRYELLCCYGEYDYGFCNYGERKE